MTRNTFLIVQRSYLSFIGTWGFWLGMIMMPVMIGIVSAFLMIEAGTSSTRYYVVLEQNNTVVADAIYEKISKRRNLTAEEQREIVESNLDSMSNSSTNPNEIAFETVEYSSAKFVEVKSPVNTIDELRPWLNGEQTLRYRNENVELFAAIVVPTDDKPVEYWSQNVIDDSLVAIVESALYELARRDVFNAQNVPHSILKDVDDAVRSVVKQRLRDEGDDQSSEVTFSDRAPFVMAIAMSFLLFFLIMSAVSFLLLGTIEEKSNRLFDCLLTSVSLYEFLLGKLIAVMLVSLSLLAVLLIILVTPFALIAVFAPLGLQEQEFLRALTDALADPNLLIPTLLCFLLGYIMYGSMFLAIGSLCESEQDSNTLVTPVMLVLFIPCFILGQAVSNPSSNLLDTVSWIPLFTPFLLMVRIPTEASLFEIIGQMVLMAVTSAIVLAASIQIFRTGAVQGLNVSDMAGRIASIFKRK